MNKPVGMTDQDVRRAQTTTYQQLLDLDTQHEIPDLLREDKPGAMPLKPIPASRYTSQAFFDLEVQKVFLKTWQWACREEEIPQPGDTHVFDLVGHSLLLTRQADGGIKAMRNICRHRGRKLVLHSGHRNAFKCPYHGFTWNTDGSFKECPLPWDFPQIDTEAFGLPEVRVESWAGFVFVNFDPDARPLLELLDPIPRHFARWNMDDCYKAAHVAKVMPANWKATIEAFLEASHVATTHPQVSTYIADANTQYDLLSDHVDRMMSATGMPSPQLDLAHLTEEQVFQHMVGTGSRAGLGETKLSLKEGMTPRAYGAELARQGLLAETGYDYSFAADAEVLDGISYQFFPNFAIWGGMGGKTCYRWRPVGRSVDQTLMEVMIYKRHPKGQKRESVPMRMLGPDDKWADCAELGFLAGVYDQDSSNLGPQQQGLFDLGDEPIHFGRYTELRCRNLHRMLDEYMAR
jgi:phenylpropionate dioxygenase-like ring-hydroxylating dioxygenase large terminal subunit